ncbi:CYTH domain-containing protein [Myroides pelagicus]|uniref:CYTH domain-containing protein n=1 Tax=Myroides pelagicus TaxID=270914 RepID=A0A7K1GLN9_9FLAO|nr:CYTH domain-containing protein [Myroides pelagicus]MEC4112749.1 CYTH domain-containing protein [Myroides pelagicus]MTH29660.1 CYTH domain-containing protein [Myroides pelagicus]
MIEIERKFLVKSNDFISKSYKKSKITQGYLNSNSNRTVRVRIKGNHGYITVKGKSNLAGTSRFEWEKEIDINEVEQLIHLCEDFVIDKTRYLVDFKGHTFEVDIFHGNNEGLILAEIELTNENETFDQPDWLGQEVTGDIRYYNSYIAKNPFKNW